MVERGIPVMAHVGLTPQAINTLGGFRARGRSEAEWQPIIDDARAVAEAGAFCVVLEAIAEPLARADHARNRSPDDRNRCVRRL